MRSRLLGALSVALLVACTPSGDDAARPEQTAPRGDSDCAEIAPLIKRVRRGWYPERSPELSFVAREPHFVGLASMPPHTGPWDFLADIPLVLYGPGFIEPHGNIDRRATLVDLAPTIAALVDFDQWPEGSGRVLQEALSGGDRLPRLVVTIVWDGAGNNALEAHEGRWPFLRSLMTGGSSYSDMTIGSTPSNTPPIHANIGTGVWPRRHGVVSVKQRDENNADVDPWLNEDPSTLESPTLADLYDRGRDNVPEIGVVATVNWHLGMIGHGAAWEGGDKDLAMLLNSSGLSFGNPAFYEVPAVTNTSALDEHTRTTDASDGELDGEWRGNPLDDLSIRYATPAFATFQEEVLEEVVEDFDFGPDEVPDLLYVNFKQSDDAGHKWGLDSPEVGEVIAAQDRALRDFVRHLDEHVGRGRWVVMLTADHGMMPYPQDSAGRAIGGAELKDDINAEFDGNDNGRDVVERVVAQGAYVNTAELRVNDATLQNVASWIARYTVEDNLGEDDSLPGYLEGREDELLFDAVVVRDGTAIRNCGVGRS